MIVLYFEITILTDGCFKMISKGIFEVSCFMQIICLLVLFRVSCPKKDFLFDLLEKPSFNFLETSSAVCDMWVL